MTTVGLLLLSVVAAGYVRATLRRLAETDDAALWAAESCLLLLLALATGWPALSLVLTRQRVARLVVQASAVPLIGGLGQMLGDALHDPTVRLLYRPQGENEGYLIDADGNPAQPSAQLTPLVREPTPSPTSIMATPSSTTRATSSLRSLGSRSTMNACTPNVRLSCASCALPGCASWPPPTANVDAWNVTCTTVPNSGSSHSPSASSLRSSTPTATVPGHGPCSPRLERKWMPAWPSCAPSHAGCIRENWPTRA